jgi:Holliday junction resolvase RusA-like endonuclease
MIHMSFGWLPPSANNAYLTLMKGSGAKRVPVRVLTPEGKRFKMETSTYLVREYPTELKTFRPNCPYGITMQFSFPNLYNAGWPAKAQTRYKKIDVDNRIKLLMDALKDAAGIDDSNFLDERAMKVHGPEMTNIWVWNMEEECPQSIQ